MHILTTFIGMDGNFGAESAKQSVSVGMGGKIALLRCGYFSKLPTQYEDIHVHKISKKERIWDISGNKR